MKCTVCGSTMKKKESRLPFRLSEDRLVIIDDVPAYECTNCQEYLLEDSVLKQIDSLLANVAKETELEIVKFAA